MMNYYKIKDEYFENKFIEYNKFQHFVMNYNSLITEHESIVKKGKCSFSVFLRSHGVTYQLSKEYCEKNNIEYNECLDDSIINGVGESYLLYLFHTLI